jgi:hypothetical protein
MMSRAVGMILKMARDSLSAEFADFFCRLFMGLPGFDGGDGFRLHGGSLPSTRFEEWQLAEAKCRGH